MTVAGSGSQVADDSRESRTVTEMNLRNLMLTQYTVLILNGN